MEKDVQFITLKFSFKCPSFFSCTCLCPSFVQPYIFILDKTMSNQNNASSLRRTADSGSLGAYRTQLYFDKYRNAGLWKKRFVPSNLKTLENNFKTRNPHKLRTPLQRPEQIETIKKLNNINPNLGRAAIAGILKEIDYKISSSTVGRILKKKTTIGD